MSAWGKSWGVAFGVAFGVVTAPVTPVEPPITPVINSGGGVFRDPSVVSLFAEDLSEQIKQEDEIIILAVAQLIVQGAFL